MDELDRQLTFLQKESKLSSLRMQRKSSWESSLCSLSPSSLLSFTNSVDIDLISEYGNQLVIPH